MKQVIYEGATDAQVNWGSGSDPRKHGLVVGQKYTVIDKEIHSWHTTIKLEGVPNLWFNDSSFREV